MTHYCITFNNGYMHTFEAENHEEAVRYARSYVWEMFVQDLHVATEEELEWTEMMTQSQEQ